MQLLVLLIHVLVAIAIIGLVLIQHGKGADMGAGFGGGASQTMFGSAGATPFIVKFIAILAAIFFITSLGLGYMTALQAKHARGFQLPSSSQTAPAKKPTKP